MLGHFNIFSSHFPKTQDFIYIFHIPLFFIVSTYNVSNDNKAIIRSILKLMAIYIICILYMSGLDYSKFIYVFTYSNYHAIGNIAWFLPALISFQVLLLISNIKYVRYIVIFLSLYLIINVNILYYYNKSIPWNILLGLYLLIPSLILKKIDKIITKEFIIDNKFFIYLAIIINILIIYIYQPISGVNGISHKIDLAQGIVPKIYLYPSFIIFMVSAGLLFKSNLKNEYIELIGRATLYIYLLHIFIVNFIVQLNTSNILKYIYLIFSIYIISLMVNAIKKIINEKNNIHIK